MIMINIIVLQDTKTLNIKQTSNKVIIIIKIINIVITWINNY